MSLVEVANLSVSFGARRVLHDVSFTLDRGETLALVGESGSGKSVTALSLLQLLPGTARSEGRIVIDGQSVIGASDQDLRRLRGGVAGMVFQEPMTSLNPLKKIGRQVGEAVELHNPAPLPVMRRRTVEVLAEAGFADAEHRLDAYPHQLSGGQRQRVMIAMALANNPALLIADEPTTALDVTIQAQILQLIVAEKKARHLATLVVSHDLAIVKRYADRVCVMKDGRIVEQGPVREVFGNPRHEYTCMLLAAQPRGRPEPVRTDAKTLIEARDMQVLFPIRRGMMRRTVGYVRAVDGIAIDVREGETVGLVGESGSGKSTAGFALLRLEPAQGHIVFEGRDLDDVPKRERRRVRARAQIVFQDPFGSLSPRLNVGEIVAEGLAVHEPKLSRAARQARVEEVLAEVGLPEGAAEHYPHEFSGGQRQRVAIARAMILRPRFVVLDEPTSALDMSVQAQIVDLLRRLQRDHDLGYLFISHDLRVVKALAHRVLVMRRGKIVEAGTAEQIFAAPREDYTRALMAAAFKMQTAEGAGEA